MKQNFFFAKLISFLEKKFGFCHQQAVCVYFIFWTVSRIFMKIYGRPNVLLNPLKPIGYFMYLWA